MHMYHMYGIGIPGILYKVIIDCHEYKLIIKGVTQHMNLLPSKRACNHAI